MSQDGEAQEMLICDKTNFVDVNLQVKCTTVHCTSCQSKYKYNPILVGALRKERVERLKRQETMRCSEQSNGRKERR